MKKIIIATALILPLLFSCKGSDGGSTETVSRVVISQDKVNLLVGETTTLTATVYPESLGMGVNWTVIDPDLASCENGFVTAKAEGVTYVVATSADGAKKASCMVSVNPPVRYSVSITDSFGVPMAELSGYPGMASMLYASTTDGEIHEFNWSVTDPATATIGNDGVIVLGAVKSSNAKYVYDAQSTLSVRTEEDYGCSIPIRSNLLNGVSVEGEYYPAGLPVTVVENTEYSIALQYESADGNVSIPASAVNLELSNNENFKLSKTGTNCSLIVNTASDVSTTLSVNIPGLSEKVEVARFVVEKAFPIKATLSDASSSTLAFRWGFPAESTDYDISKAYTATLYKDSECTIVDQSFDIPAALEAWNGKQPCFVFGGLEPSTTYWLKVYDTADELESNLVEAKTSAFNVVEMPASITEPGVVLAEDFGELRWDFDSPFGAVGYFPSNNSSFSNTGVSEYRKTAAGSEKTFKSFSTALKNSRLNNWATDSNVYVHPGHLKLGTSSARGWILTPEFTVPAGKKAIVSVTITACRFNSSQDSNWAVSVLNQAQAGVDAAAHTSSFEWPDENDTKVYQKIEFTGNCVWSTNTVEGLELHHLDRITFGGVKGGSGTKGRVLISDITVTVKEIVYE